MVEILKTRCNTSGTRGAHVEACVPFNISGQGRPRQEGHKRADYRLGKAVQTATAMAAAQTKAHAWNTGEGARWPGGRATELKSVFSSYSSVSALGKGSYRWL